MYISLCSLMLSWPRGRRGHLRRLESFTLQLRVRDRHKHSARAISLSGQHAVKSAARDPQNDEAPHTHEYAASKDEDSWEGTTEPTVRRVRSREREDTLQRRELRKQGKYEEAKRSHIQPPEGLPLPPFLRKKKDTDRFREWYQTGTFQSNNRYTQKEKESKAPFATAFALNPYAQALGGPVREDGFTGARMPKSCMIDFHLVTGDDEKTRLLPVGLAAASLRKNKYEKMTDAEKDVKKTHEAEQSWTPQGNATYVIAKKEGMDFIAENATKRVHTHAMSVKMVKTVEENQLGKWLEWDNDTCGIVLKKLREIVRQKLSPFLIGRNIPDRDALLAALPGQWGLKTLDEVDAVGCVLRLKPVDSQAGPEPNRVPEPEKPIRAHFYPNQTSFLGSTYGDFDEQSPAEKEAAEKADRVKRGEAEPELEPAAWASETQVLMTEHWSREDARRAPFLGHVLPLPSPTTHATWYFPTVRWRKQRVPVYDLTRLLGQSELDRLFGETSFKDVAIATLKQTGSTASALIWLLKLQAFLAKPKTETIKV